MKMTDTKSITTGVRSSIYPVDKYSSAKRIIESMIPEKTPVFLVAWLLAIVCALFLMLSLTGEATQFFGVAQSREQSISFRYPVEIVAIPVVEGEDVSANYTLLRVRRYDLDAEQESVEAKLSEVIIRRQESVDGINAEVASLQAQDKAALAKINTQIYSLESQYTLNNALLGEISPKHSKYHSKTRSPLLTKLKGLKSERVHIAELLKARIASLKNKLNADARPIDSQISALNKRRTELIRQNSALNVRADFSGSVGSVIYKPGEQVAPFQSVLTLHSARPSFIKGIIHENVKNGVQLEQQVWVKSLNSFGEDSVVSGAVESLGGRIVEYPARLKKNPMMSAWGREVIVRLDERNPLLLGEKVIVMLRQPQPIAHRAISFLLGLISETSDNESAVVFNSEASGYWFTRLFEHGKTVTKDKNLSHNNVAKE